MPHSSSIPTTHLLLARHPETEANLERRFLGIGDSPYTDKGRQQKADLVECISAWKPDRVMSSPRRRALEVAEEIARGTGAELLSRDGIAEVDFGPAEGLTYDEIVRKGIPMDYLGGPADRSPYGAGEGWNAFSERVVEVGKEAVSRPGRVAIIAHGGVVRALLVHWMEMIPTAAWHFVIPNASVTTGRHVEDYFTLESYGVHPHACDWSPRWDALSLDVTKRSATG